MDGVSGSESLCSNFSDRGSSRLLRTADCYTALETLYHPRPLSVRIFTDSYLIGMNIGRMEQGMTRRSLRSTRQDLRGLLKQSKYTNIVDDITECL